MLCRRPKFSLCKLIDIHSFENDLYCSSEVKFSVFIVVHCSPILSKFKTWYKSGFVIYAKDLQIACDAVPK